MTDTHDAKSFSDAALRAVEHAAVCLDRAIQLGASPNLRGQVRILRSVRNIIARYDGQGTALPARRAS